MKPGPLRNMCLGLTEIADGLLRIVSLGVYHPSLSWKFTCWAEVRYLEQRYGKEINLD